MSDAVKWDIEEPEEVLDAAGPSSVEFWEEKQKELVTSVVDYNLGTLADLVRTKAIDLSPKYQRRFRWDDARQSKLIESFLMNVPVPPIFLNEDVYGQYSVIDGKQRLNAICRFFSGELHLRSLEVFHDINNLGYHDLPPRLQTAIRTRPTLRAVIILHQSDEDVKFEVFQRLNTGGVRLNPQEIRNSTYTGPLNNMILDLSVDAKFHRLLGIKNKERSAIYQQMRDAEFVLRYLTFRDTWPTFRGGMKRHMDRYMAEHRHMKEDGLHEAHQDFLATLAVVDAAFGEHAYQRWVPQNERWKRQVVASLYDAEMFACKGLDADVVGARRPQILAAVQQLFTDGDFRKAIDAATNTPAYFRSRIRMLQRVLEDGVG